MSALARRFIPDSQDSNRCIIHSVQDVGPILEANKRHMNAPRRSSRLHHNGLECWYRVATIPYIQIEKWMQEGINFFTHEGFAHIVKNKLNDPDFSGFRTAPGRL
jgi:hypothetical protein